MNPRPALFFQLILITACNISFAGKHNHAPIQVTSFPIWSVLTEIAPKEQIDSPLLTPGSSPHTHGIKPSDAHAIYHSKAIFGIAPHLDGWATQKGVQHFNWIDGLPKSFRIKMKNGKTDPHFWLDPLAVKATLPYLSHSLCSVLKDLCEKIKTRTQIFSASLESLHRRIRTTLMPFKNQKVALSHSFFIYFLKRYEIQLSFIVHQSPSGQVGPKRIKNLIDQIKIKKPRSILTLKQNPSSRSAVQTLRRATGINILELDPIGGTKSIRNYNSLIYYNANRLPRGLL